MIGMFYGTLDEFKDKVLSIDNQGEWLAQHNGVYRYKLQNNATLFWSENNGTVWCQGSAPLKAALESELKAILSG